MFGVSFGELVMLAIIGMVVVGPRNLPEMMRTLGRSLSKARRMATNLREQSGIDDILRHEGIEKEFSEFRKLATGRILDLDIDALSAPRHAPPPRQREYPVGGVDVYGALPEDAAPYVPTLAAASLDAPAFDAKADPYAPTSFAESALAAGPQSAEQVATADTVFAASALSPMSAREPHGARDGSTAGVMNDSLVSAPNAPMGARQHFGTLPLVPSPPPPAASSTFVPIVADVPPPAASTSSVPVVADVPLPAPSTTPTPVVPRAERPGLPSLVRPVSPTSVTRIAVSPTFPLHPSSVTLAAPLVDGIDTSWEDAETYTGGESEKGIEVEHEGRVARGPARPRLESQTDIDHNPGGASTTKPRGEGSG